MLTFPASNKFRITSGRKVLVAQLGSRQDYTVPIALQNLGYLQRFYTDTYLSQAETQWLEMLSQIKWFCQPISKFLSRQNNQLNFSKISRFNLLGFRYVQALKRATSIEEQYRAFINYGKLFNQAILRKGLPEEATHIYAFDHAALDLFQVARSQGMRCILDQIYAGPYHEKVAQAEQKLWPDWSLTSGTSFCQSYTFEEWCDIQFEEWRLADQIIVASQYTRRAISKLTSAFESKIEIVPITVDLNAYIPFQHIRYYDHKRPLKVLFVGRVSLQKGIHYLLKAFEKISPTEAQLTVVGSIQVRREKLAAFEDKVNFCGVVSHSQLPQIYRDADLLVFPTISDGFGAVMLEAMTTGLPVISTECCGDIVEDGVNGYRVPIRQPDAIAQKIRLLIQEPELITHLSQGAIATSQKYSLQQYQSKLSQALNLLAE